MKALNKEKRASVIRRRKLFAGLITVLVTIIGVVWFVALRYQENLSLNYAEETAKPIEEALIKAGGIKLCGAGDDGRGPDDRKPDYHAIFKIPGTRQQATELVMNATKGVGYTLGPGTLPADPKDNKFYADNSSKQSSYRDLQSGPVALDIEIFGSSTYTDGGNFCSVTERENPPSDQTTIWVTVNLPSFK